MNIERTEWELEKPITTLFVVDFHVILYILISIWIRIKKKTDKINGKNSGITSHAKNAVIVDVAYTWTLPVHEFKIDKRRWFECYCSFKSIFNKKQGGEKNKLTKIIIVLCKSTDSVFHDEGQNA